MFFKVNEDNSVILSVLEIEGFNLLNEVQIQDINLLNAKKLMYNSDGVFFDGFDYNNLIPLFELYPNVTLEDAQNGKVQLDQLRGLTRLEPISDKGIKPSRNYVKDDILVWSIQDVDYISENDNPKRTETIVKIFNNIGGIVHEWISKIKLLRPEDIAKELKIRRSNILAYLQGNAPDHYNFLYHFFKNDIEIWLEINGNILSNSLIDASQNHSNTLVIATLNAQAIHSVTGEPMVKPDGTPLTNLEAILHELS